MKMRLFAYLILLPIALLVGLTDWHQYVNYIGWIFLGLTFGLAIFALIKTRAFYKMKKCLVFFLFIFCMFGGFSNAWAQFGAPYPMYGQYGYHDPMIQLQAYQRQLQKEMGDLLKELTELDRIPESERTPEQQRRYLEARARYQEIQKQLGIIPCPKTQELYAEFIKDCWSCDVANLFIEAGDKVASGFYKLDKQQGYSKSLLVIGFLFWLILHVLKLIMSFGTGDIGGFFTGLFQKLLLVGGLFIILTLPMQNIVSGLISPFFLFSSSVSQEIAKQAKPVNNNLSSPKLDEIMKSTFSGGVDCSYCKKLEEGDESLPDRKISEAVKYTASASERVVSPMMRNSLLCTICTIYQITAPPTITGQFLYCNSKNIQGDGRDIGKRWIYKDWDAWLVGIGLIVSFFLMSALFSFYLIDTFFRIVFTLILLPFLIVALGFQSTRKYTKKGLDVMIHSMATYIIIALFMTLTIQIFYVMMGPDAAEITALTAANDYKGIRGLVGFGEGGGRILLSCFGIVLIVFFMLRQLDGYIQELTGIQLGNDGGSTAVMAATAAVGGAVRTAKDMTTAGIGDIKDLKKAKDMTKPASLRQFGEDVAGVKGGGDSDGAMSQGVNTVAGQTEKGMNKVGDATAEGVDKAGTAASKGMMKGGAKMCGAAYGLGAIIGVPVMAAGAALYVGTKVAKVAIKVGTRVASKATSMAIKGTNKAFQKTKKSIKKAKEAAKKKYLKPEKKKEGDASQKTPPKSEPKKGTKEKSKNDGGLKTMSEEHRKEMNEHFTSKKISKKKYRQG